MSVTNERDILTVTKGVIVHQVNCQGVMGSGIAKAIREKWPVVYSQYKSDPPALGDVQIVPVASDLFVCNLAGQDGFGSRAVYTDYNAVRSGLQKLAKWNDAYGREIHIPFKMSCGLGGGDWRVVTKIIEEELANHKVVICELPSSPLPFR